MAMNMRRAFNARMMTEMKAHTVLSGSFDDDNDWVAGSSSSYTIYGVMTTGNKFSQFDEGISRHIEEGGERTTDYWSLYVTEDYPIAMQDKIEFHGAFYNVLQKSDEIEFGFRSYLLERSERWKP